MPKRRDRNKKSGSQIRDRTRRGESQPRSVSELLARAGGATLRQIKLQPFDWATLVRERLSAELALHLRAAEFADGRLTLFTESAAWSARLRYAMADAEAALRGAKPEIREIVVRVAPASSAPRPGRRP
jgi:predicted nucleic acid-binding Zn ribbon protein